MRLVFIDDLRCVLTVLVVGHHSFLAISGLGQWYSTGMPEHEQAALLGDEPVAQALVATLLFTSQSFLTSLLFGLAGLLMPRSLAKKGPSQYLRSRIWRLGGPVVLVGLPVHHAAQGLAGKDWWTFSGPGVAWFQLWLLAFEAAFVAARAGAKHRENPKAVTLWTCLGVMALVASLQCLMELHVAKPVAAMVGQWKGLAHHLTHTPLYGGCFFCGTLFEAGSGLPVLPVQPLLLLSVASVLLCFLFALDRKPSQKERPTEFVAVALGAIMTVAICAGLCSFLLVSFQRKRRWSLAWCSECSYAVNMLHPLVVVAATPLAASLPVGLLGRCLALWTMSALVSYAWACLARRSSWVRALL
ncbi:unnamed protein product [Effrenium voratum]|nr:unnamed protein product [Effrenium voratum]